MKNQNPTKQQLLSHQALRFEHPQDLIRLSPVTMPSRQEVFEGLRTLVGGGDGEPSDPVLHDLCIDQSHQPRRECPGPRSEPNSPAGSRSSSPTPEISELGQIITNKMMDPHSRSSGPQSPDTTRRFRSLELMEEEELQHSAMGLNMSGSVVPGTSQVPMMIPQTMPMPSPVVPKTPTKTAGILLLVANPKVQLRQVCPE